MSPTLEVPSPEEPVQNLPRSKKRHFIGIVITCICLTFIVVQIDLDELRAALSQFKWPYLFLGVASLAAGYVMRIFRWWVMLRAAGADIRPMACAAPFLGSIALNNVLPARLGDVIRALVFPTAIGLGRVTSAGSLFMERLVDLMTLLACLALGLVFSTFTNAPEWVGRSAIGLALTGGITLALMFLFSGHVANWCGRMADDHHSSDRKLRVRIFATLRDLFRGLAAMSRLPVLIALFLLSLLVWAGESGLFWALLQGFGFDAGPAFAVSVMAITTLSTLVPSSPGYVGPFHVAAYAAVSMFGGTPGLAASFAVLSHLGLWLPTTIAGVLAILFNPDLFRLLRNKPALNGTTISRN